MCGIVGYISLKDEAHPLGKRHFSDYALMLDTLRGSDSTGIIRVNNEFDVHTLHTTAPGAQYVHTEEYDEWMKKFDGWAMIGHNRAATAGSVKLENAHPFTFGQVTMVHNGTLHQQGKTMPGYDPKLEVDSMQIAKALSRTKPKSKHVAELLEKIDGSFALVWVDRRDDSINMCRNSSRPIHFGFNRSKDIMYFMSDGNHLRSIMNSMSRSPSAVDTIYSLDKHKILKFKKGSLVPEVTSFRPFVRPTYSQPTRGSHDASGVTTPKHGQALATAAKRWQDGARAAHGNMQRGLSGGLSSEGKCLIGKDRRLVPKNHRTLLEEWYDLSVDDLVQFLPQEWMELEGKMCTVHGHFIHPKWGFCEWPMTLHNVPLVICTAYADYDWAVRCKGVGTSFSEYKSADVMACVGELYCYDWNMVNQKPEEVKEEEEEEVQEELDLDTGLVVGPEEMLMERGKCMELLADGCIQCSSAVEWEDRQQCVVVNEGRDILCPGCATEWMKEATL